VIAKAEIDLTHNFIVMDLREAAKQNQKKNTDLFQLSGRIIDQNGSPVVMAYIMADKNPRFKEMPSYISPWTDSSGGYLLLLPQGKYHLGATTTYPPEPGQTLPIAIDLSVDTDNVDLKIITEDTGKPTDHTDAD
ncbi:MAG: carboxypeptidase-like regulatory domain-containing protein, partial [Desulfobulbaceae bacterium]|nr:carboxypeptidase-like regulatory domain-containing protein [Desulfobulbaceae bacterium]